uniref:Uncharacterized protein n=1 Tax=uncultured marine microorganism HF4000_009G21 TaxID=455515 RepID=B3T1B3_9ZZZZ|nr:hypothetical protein ALOHA_HF4000009G21ctg1g8 [uncultured marine microorganism HF4000_009G21]
MPEYYLDRCSGGQSWMVSGIEHPGQQRGFDYKFRFTPFGSILLMITEAE